MNYLARVGAVALLAAGLITGGAVVAQTPRTVLYRVAAGAGQQVRFEARTNTETYAGTTDNISGEIRFRPDAPSSGPSARFAVSVGSLSTGNGGRDSKMRRSHLEVDQNPVAVFTLVRGETASPLSGPLPVGKPVTGIAHGTLLLHGVTRQIAPVVTVTRETDAQNRDTLHIVARFVVRLEDYHIPTPRLLFITVKQEHNITVDVRAVAVP